MTWEQKVLAELAELEPLTNANLRSRLGMEGRGYVREIDVALQKLRKAGLIELAKPRGWRRTGYVTCPQCGGTGKVRP